VVFRARRSESKKERGRGHGETKRSMASSARGCSRARLERRQLSFLSRPQLPSPLAWSPMRPPSRLALAVQDASVSALASRGGTSPGRPAVSGGVWATDQGMGSDCADLPSDAIGRLVRRRQDLDKKTRVAILTLAENTAAAVQAEKGVGVFAGCVCLRARGGGWAVGGRE
jgi:hypothetical protein